MGKVIEATSPRAAPGRSATPGRFRRRAGAALPAAMLVMAGCARLPFGLGGAPAAPAPAPVAAPPAAEAPVERAQPPEAAPPSPVTLPPVHEARLAGGARVLVVPGGEQPLVTVQVRVPAGRAKEPAELAGLADLTATLLTRGTATRSAGEVAEAIDFVGGRLEASAGADWTTVTLEVLTDFLPEGLDLLADVLLEPAFASDELEAERRRMLSALELELSQPPALATRRFLAEVYGGHPYGVAATPGTVAAVERADVEAFHARWYAPGEALIVVAGDVSPPDVVARLEERLAGWEGGGELGREVFAAAEPAGRRLVFVHKPGTVQAVLRVGHLLPSAGHADWVELDVMNEVLGGNGFTSWLGRTLRAQKGYTYGAGSSAVERRDAGYFVAATEVRNAVADSALSDLLGLLGRMRADTVPAADLRLARDFLSGSFPLTVETPGQVATQLATGELLGRPTGWLESYRQRVAGVTAADVHRVAREHLHPERAVVVVVGDAAELLARLRPFAGAVELYDEAGQPLPVEAFADGPVPLHFDATAVAPGVQRYVLRHQGSPIAEATTTVTRETEDGRDVVRAVTQVTGQAPQRQEVVFTAGGFEPVRADAEGAVDFRLRREGGTVRGSVRLPGNGEGAVEVQYEDGLLFPGMEDFAVAVVDLERHLELPLRVVDPTSRRVERTLMRVAGRETVSVPAGTFEAYRLDVDGPQPGTLWVRRAPPHIVLRQAFSGRPLVLELAEAK